MTLRMIALFTGALLCCGAIPAHHGTTPQIDAPREITIHYSVPADLVFHVTWQDSASPVIVGAFGLPAGLFVVQGNPPDARVQLRVYGIVNEAGRIDSVYRVGWYVKNGMITRYVYSRLRVDAPRDKEDVAHRVEELVTSRYSHGMPQRKAHVLGSRALPVLAKMLRNEKYKASWHQIAGAMGCIGDSSAFDSLRLFIWDRFRGPVDFQTYTALQIAQANLGAIATGMPRALDYLASHVRATSWDSLPWSVSDRVDRVGERMSQETMIALAFTDRDEAGEVLEEAKHGLADTAFIEGALRVHRRVRAYGYLEVWDVGAK